MSDKTQRPSKLVIGGTVTVATIGLSTCNDNGAVDPAPPPLVCEQVGGGQRLDVGASLIGADSRRIGLVVRPNVDAFWTGTATVTGVTGARTLGAARLEPDMVVLELERDPAATAGAFTFEGTLEDFRGTRCTVRRTFTFAIQDGVVQIAQRQSRLPLEIRGGAGIVLVRREGLEVELDAEIDGAAESHYWRVTGGTYETIAGHQIRWRLPEQRGVYLAELVVDRGDDGFAFDTLSLEVS
ncbi:MAG: hypothetical protein IT384_05110 [Deltaproteobacteria bacterium]|nr:hypothetical protein [Deltaproteobacteria bacterium]